MLYLHVHSDIKFFTYKISRVAYLNDGSWNRERGGGVNHMGNPLAEGVQYFYLRRAGLSSGKFV